MAGPNPLSLISRLNHWIIAFAMIGALGLGLYAEDLSGPERGQWMSLHKALGVLILGFGLWRVGHRLVQGFPSPTAAMSRWQARAAKTVHWGLLVTVLALPLSGLAMSLFGGRDVAVFGLFTVPAFERQETLHALGEGLHGLLANALILLLVVHVLAAVKHQVLDRDGTLRRMITGTAQASPRPSAPRLSAAHQPSSPADGL